MSSVVEKVYALGYSVEMCSMLGKHPDVLEFFFCGYEDEKNVWLVLGHHSLQNQFEQCLDMLGLTEDWVLVIEDQDQFNALVSLYLVGLDISVDALMVAGGIA